MKFLVFGKTGQVARELAARAAPGCEITCLDRSAADLRDTARLRDIIATSNADAIINAAAFTAVDAAETDIESAYLVNSGAPTAMAEAARHKGIPFLHISTDYVFDGHSKQAWQETDQARPLNVYGASKRAGEVGILAANGQAIILRTSWVFSEHGRNFVTTMNRLCMSEPHLTVVEDQLGGPTWAGDIAAALITLATARVAGRGTPGLFHFTGAPATTWAGFAAEILSQHPYPSAKRVVGVSSNDWARPAQRPMNSTLDCQRIKDVFGLQQPDWRLALANVMTSMEIGHEDPRLPASVTPPLHPSASHQRQGTIA